MVCLGNISVDTLHKGDTEDNNNNNFNSMTEYGPWILQRYRSYVKKYYEVNAANFCGHRNDS